MYRDNLEAALNRLNVIETASKEPNFIQQKEKRIETVLIDVIKVEPLAWQVRPAVRRIHPNGLYDEDVDAWYHESARIALVPKKGFLAKKVFVYIVDKETRESHKLVLSVNQETLIRGRYLYRIVTRIPELQVLRKLSENYRLSKNAEV